MCKLGELRQAFSAKLVNPLAVPSSNDVHLSSSPDILQQNIVLTVDEPTIVAPEPDTTQIPASNEDAPPAMPEVVPAVVESEKIEAPEVAIPEPTPVDDAATPAVASTDVPSVEEPVPSTESAVVDAPADVDSALQAPTRPTQRKNSSVLDRVRAMETTPKPPGSFD